VGNQGEVGACAAFAIVGIMNVFHLIEMLADVLAEEEIDRIIDVWLEKHQLSEGFFYGYNRSPEAKYSGMYVEKALDFARITGSVPKVLFDELYEMPEMRERILKNKSLNSLIEEAKKYRIKGYVGFLRGEKEEIKRAIYDYKYPILGVSNSYFGESHAIMIIGWDENGFIIQNSWGEDWGNKGTKTIPLSAINYAFLLLDEVLELKFKDVSRGAWYYKAVKNCVFTGIMNGMSEDTFAPDAGLTRAQFAQAMMNKQEIDDNVNKIKADQDAQTRELLDKIVKWAYTKGFKE
jgi:hypothetical protein